MYTYINVCMFNIGGTCCPQASHVNAQIGTHTHTAVLCMRRSVLLAAETEAQRDFWLAAIKTAVSACMHRREVRATRCLREQRDSGFKTLTRREIKPFAFDLTHAHSCRAGARAAAAMCSKLGPAPVCDWLWLMVA